MGQKVGNLLFAQQKTGIYGSSFSYIYTYIYNIYIVIFIYINIIIYTLHLNLDIFSAILDIPTMGGNHFEPKWRNFAMKDPIVADEFPLPKRGFPLVKSWCGQRLNFELWERILPSQTTLSCRRSQKHRLYWFNFGFIEYIHVPANIPRYP